MLTCDMRSCNIPAAEQNMQAYAFACMLIGLEGITRSNYKEFYKRYRLHDTVNGPFFPGVDFSLAEVKRRIGLKCNVANESSAAFLKKVYLVYSDRVNREIQEEEV